MCQFSVIICLMYLEHANIFAILLVFLKINNTVPKKTPYLTFRHFLCTRAEYLFLCLDRNLEFNKTCGVLWKYQA